MDDGPRLSFGADPAPYTGYGAIDVLLDLQRPRSDRDAEMSWIITDQVMELLFKLVRHEWLAARARLRADDTRGALTALARGVRAQDTLVASWDLLAPLTPTEFARFRDVLGEASGFQSFMYRHLEFLVGNKSAALLGPHRGSPRIHAELAAALAEPSLYDEALALLHRRGLPVPASRLERDWSRPYRPHPGVERAWAEVYAREEEDPDLFALAEALLDTAERFTRWRQRHLLAVRRVLGAKPGTGGSAGLAWLRRVAEQEVFPELWSVRNHL